jgi:protocatechuate 3,4-dioxygenase beta subunit
MNDNFTLTNIGKARVTGLLGLSFVLVAALAIHAPAQTILIDDFNDGDANEWSIIDTTVGESWGPGTFGVISEAYHLEGGGLAQAGGSSALAAVWDESSDPIFTDGFVRAKVRSEVLGGTAAIMLRVSGNLETGFNLYVFFGTTANNGIQGNGAFLYNKVVNGQTVQGRQLPGSFPFGVNEDWYIEAGAVGDRLSMKVWRVGDPEPESPQLTFTDRTFSTGQFGVESNIHASPFPGPARVSATFDDIHFRFPEHDDVFTVSPYNIYLWGSPMPVPQVEGPFFVADSPEKPDMRGDVTSTEGWPDLRLTGLLTDFEDRPIPGLKLDFWQVDDQGSYDNSGGYVLRGHLFTDTEGNYELWTVMPAAYETIRTRHLHLKIGGENLGFDSPIYTTQLYFPVPYDNDIDTDGTLDKVVEGGFETEFDAIALEEDFITMADLEVVGAEFSDLVSNIVTLNNDPAVEGHFDTTLNIVMPEVFQSPEVAKRILIDNFNDGDANGWSIIDSTVGKSWGPGTFDASSGAYRLEGGGLVPVGQGGFLFATWDDSSHPTFSDGFVRAKIRAETEGSLAGIMLRYSPDNLYLFFGHTLSGGRFRFNSVVNGTAVRFSDMPGGPIFGLNEDWNIEAGAVGDQLSMKVWRVGDPEPESPQWTFTDSSLSTGDIGIIAAIDDRFRQPARVSTTFDDIYFVPPPDVDDSSGQ